MSSIPKTVGFNALVGVAYVLVSKNLAVKKREAQHGHSEKKCENRSMKVNTLEAHNQHQLKFPLSDLTS